MKRFAEACEPITIGFAIGIGICAIVGVLLGLWKLVALYHIPCGGWLLAGLGGATLVTIIGAGTVSLWRKRHDHSR